MDEIDRLLLQILQQDATLSIAQMADRVGLSATPCWKRVQKLEAAGVITRRVAIVDPDRVGVGLTVLVGIEAGEHTPDWLQCFSSGVAAMPEVMEVYRLAGDVDYLLRVAVADSVDDQVDAEDERRQEQRQGDPAGSGRPGVFADHQRPPVRYLYDITLVSTDELAGRFLT